MLSKKDSSLLLISIFISICIMGMVKAQCDTDHSKILLENARPYNDLGSSMTFYVYYLKSDNTPINGTSVNVTANFSNSLSPMTYANGKYHLTVTSSSNEDVLFLITASDNGTTCKTASFTSRWRIPYYVSVDLYKQELNSSNPARYANDFQYVVMVERNGKNTDDMGLLAFNNGVDSLFDSTLGFVTGTTSESVNVMPPDHNVYYWGMYAAGEARIKLYEPSNYTIYVMSNKIIYPINYFWEFQRPTAGKDSYMGNVYDNVALYDQNNISNTPYSFNNTVIKVSLTKFEANAYSTLMNWFYIAIFIIVYILVIWLSIVIFGSMPGGWRFILAIAIGGLVIGMGILWAA